MATWKYSLAEPPSEPRALDLWLQHAAGFILFEDVRKYAIEHIDPSLSPEARGAAEKGIADALYGLMQVIDGVSGALGNDKYNVNLDFITRLARRTENQDWQVVSEVNLANGDGMCMGYHGWVEGDFGRDAVAVGRDVA